MEKDVDDDDIVESPAHALLAFHILLRLVLRAQLK